jgi:preprotein translocase subunit SecB
MENQETKKENISPDKYREILKGLNMESIYLLTSKSSVDKKSIASGLRISFRDEASFEKKEDKIVEITHKYRLEATNRKLKKKVLNIECAFCLIYSFGEEFSADFFEVFKDINLPLNTWPFFREFVFNITSRMNIPPLTLPLLKR